MRRNEIWRDLAGSSFVNLLRQRRSGGRESTTEDRLLERWGVDGELVAGCLMLDAGQAGRVRRTRLRLTSAVAQSFHRRSELWWTRWWDRSARQARFARKLFNTQRSRHSPEPAPAPNDKSFSEVS